MNVFLIETPLQLLNAIEAKNYFKLENNHLVVRLGEGPPERLKELIAEHDWNAVHYFKFYYPPFPSEFVSSLLGQRISEYVSTYFYYYYKYINRKKIDNIINSLGSATNIFLGNYMTSIYSMKHMRHFANTLKHDRLFILDDGTDVIRINDDRRNAPARKPNLNRSGSYISRLKAMLRDSLIEWNDRDADNVTFFSAYDIDVRDSDRLVKNEYRHLRGITKRAVPSDEVFFVGQWMVEIGYMKEELYLEYLNKVKNYFVNEKIVYVPHPRESSSMIKKINECLGFTIKRFNVPIEYEICIRGTRPKILASFFSSALHNCRVILNDNITIKSFYISPNHMLSTPTHVQQIYEYFEAHTSELFTVVRL